MNGLLKCSQGQLLGLPAGSVTRGPQQLCRWLGTYWGMVTVLLDWFTNIFLTEIDSVIVTERIFSLTKLMAILSTLISIVYLIR